MRIIDPAVAETIVRLNEAKITFSIDLDMWDRSTEVTPEVETTWRDAAARLGLEEISFDRHDSPNAKEAWAQHATLLLTLELGELAQTLAREVLSHVE